MFFFDNIIIFLPLVALVITLIYVYISKVTVMRLRLSMENDELVSSSERVSINSSGLPESESVTVRIKNACSEVFAEVAKWGILNHEIAACASIMTKRILAKNGQLSSPLYKILKYEKDELEYGQAAVVCSKQNYASITVPTIAPDINNSDILKVRLSVAHELGHIVLGHQNPNSENEEDEATCFAYILVRNRAELYADESFIKENQFTDDEIKNTIKEIRPNFNLELLISYASSFVNDIEPMTQIQ